MNHKTKIAFVGLGLIGGSIAKAIRQYYPDHEIIAFDKSKETLALATQESVVDVACTSIDDNFANCNYIFLCAPVAYNTAYLKQLKNYVSEDCILTDVGSVKTSIHKEIISLDMEANFIGGHPMAGSEKSGFANSKAHLIENAYYILTPSAKVSQEKLDSYYKFVESLKALPVTLSYEEHDYITGVISHLPHIIASTLVNFVKENDGKEELMKHLAAGGFKDITRIASSSPTMWQHICESNTENISLLLTDYILMLQDIQSALNNNTFSDIYDLFAQSGNYRNSINDRTKGSILKDFHLYLDIRDETGAIAKIVTLLADHKINIKNIGITHNRELGEGVLYIAFYDEIALQDSIPLLKKEGYTLFLN